MPAETARAFRHFDEDDSTVVAGIDGSRTPLLMHLGELRHPKDGGLVAGSRRCAGAAPSAKRSTICSKACVPDRAVR
jgi:hypothetical protein